MNFNSATMRLNNADTVPYLTYNSLSEIKFINHAFSTRLGGVSEGEFTSMNMAFNRGDNPDAVTENYRRICESAGFEFDSLTASAQDHHTFVRAVTRENRGVGIYRPRDMESVDAIMTNEKGVTIVTYYADCTPLFFVDTENKAIALAHAGWRGTVGRIGEKVVKEMGERYGTKPENITAAIGPAISVCCYGSETRKICISEGRRQVHDRPARDQPSDSRRGRREERGHHDFRPLHKLQQRASLEPPSHKGTPRYDVCLYVLKVISKTTRP